MTLAFKRSGSNIVLLGETKGWLGASLYLREVAGREEGAPPPVALHRERRKGELVRQLIQDGQVLACHDVSDGGLLVAVAEMAMPSGIGAAIEIPSTLPLHAWCFGEDQGRYLLEVSDDDLVPVLAAAEEHEVGARVIGKTGGHVISVGGRAATVDELKAINEKWLPEFMGAEMSGH
jgi:phosphoribosylformylglycinamidine (FGAM) synthase-like enzyme